MLYLKLKKKLCISACFALFVMFPHFCNGEPVVHTEVVTAVDMLSMTPLCKLLVVEKPGAHMSGGSHPSAEDMHLFQRPGYEMGATNMGLHHYCWAQVAKIRYLRAPSSKRGHYFSVGMGDLDYLLRNSPKTWPYLDVIYVEKGEWLRLRKEYVKSIAVADEALSYQPESERAYVLKVDNLIDMGDRKRAVDVALEGLLNAKQHRKLKLRLKKLGAEIPQHVLDKLQSIDSANKSSEPLSEQKVDNLDKDQAVEAVQLPALNKQVFPEKHNGVQPGHDAPPNPYCRFCP